ncbi:MAG: DUF4240 domain-containing protein [Planctomycetaceae bacterium]
MNRDEFWSMIEATRSGNDPYERAEAVQSALCERTAADIIAFEQHMANLLTESYTWSLWGAAYLINGGCSDDGFDYFRGWLITQGRSVFEQALADPDSLADIPDLEEDVECEDILSVAPSAYESVTGEEIPVITINLPDLGEGWDFDDDTEMKHRYPRLFAKFCED